MARSFNGPVDTLRRRMLQKKYRCFQRSHAEMVGVAQLVERQTVDLDVAGSNPVTHPKQNKPLN